MNNHILTIYPDQDVGLTVMDEQYEAVISSLQEARVLCDWIVKEIGPHTPIHFISFHPSYKLESASITSQDVVEAHCDAATKAGLNYSYVANFPGHQLENTYCPQCHER